MDAAATHVQANRGHFGRDPTRRVTAGGRDWNAHSKRGRGGREAERRVSTGKGEWRGVGG